ncbi:hypothetical protein FGADI_9331 [Fusarium gaditjirri]|uniref:Uncharacterized protein n=1 Tax=Fusarium gaditjirri TaxID=282569 RepID=A0A8H4T0E9_9HYPO|nr:hypothetical protein FGADI_9331 [Fusarium gaditjirri]
MARNSPLGDILAPGDTAQLVNRDLVNFPNPPNGSIQIHKCLFNSASDKENKKIPLDANIESRPDTFVTVPEKLISRVTIEYIGFSSDKAREIWSDWNAQPMIREFDFDNEIAVEVAFIDWVKGGAGDALRDDIWADDNAAWFRYMEQHGIAIELQHKIMDPGFRGIRLTGTCLGWLRDTMEMRYRGLRNIQRASAERERTLGTSSQPRKPRLEFEAFCGDMQHTNTEPRDTLLGQAKRREGVASVVIVQIAIQNSAIEAMDTPGLHMSRYFRDH